MVRGLSAGAVAPGFYWWVGAGERRPDWRCAMGVCVSVGQSVVAAGSAGRGTPAARIDAYDLTALLMVVITLVALRRLLRRR